MCAKAVMLIMDGVGDRRCATLSGLTPLEAARGRAFDLLAQHGECGIVDVVSPGLPNGSDTGHLALLGYDPFKYYTGRGPLEALGAGVELKPGDVAFRCNFATVDDDGVIVDRRAGRISTDEARVLAEALQGIKIRGLDGVEIEFIPTVEHRGVLVMRGRGLSDKVSDVDPHKTGTPLHPPRPLDKSAKARKTAKALMAYLEKARQVLSNHPLNKERREKGLNPANALLTRGAGHLPKLEPFSERYGLKAAVIAGGALYKGVCKAAGFDVINVEGATGTVNTNLNGKMEAALRALDSYDFVLVHVKGTDSASHDKNPVTKVRVIKNISEAFQRVVDRAFNEGTYVVVTADHSTPVEIGEHRGDPVPVVIYGHDVRRDNIEVFDEIACARGGLGRIRGIDIMPILCNYLGKMPLYGE